MITHDEDALDEHLSRPTPAVRDALLALEGDIAILGAGGKMGPSLARMARRALDDAGIPREGTGARRVYAVARFSDPSLANTLATHGIEPIRADLTNPDAVRALPLAQNVLHLVGQKFGTADDPVGTWALNVVAATHVAHHFRDARIVMFSTGNVYPRTNPLLGGAVESHALVPNGEYAASCIGRERVFEHVAHRYDARVLLFRLCYACDLRYGVLTDIAVRLQAGAAISLSTPFANVIWQGDANALALRALTCARADSPALNVSGPITSIRAAAIALANELGTEAQFTDERETDALVVNVDALAHALPHDGMPLHELMHRTAQWVKSGGRLLGKPTRFDVHSGTY